MKKFLINDSDIEFWKEIDALIKNADTAFSDGVDDYNLIVLPTASWYKWEIEDKNTGNKYTREKHFERGILIRKQGTNVLIYFSDKDLEKQNIII